MAANFFSLFFISFIWSLSQFSSRLTFSFSLTFAYSICSSVIFITHAVISIFKFIQWTDKKDLNIWTETRFSLVSGMTFRSNKAKRKMKNIKYRNKKSNKNLTKNLRGKSIWKIFAYFDCNPNAVRHSVHFELFPH